MARYPAYKRQKRTKLFYDQKGLCYYCNKPVLLAKGPADARLAHNHATLDHIVTASKGGGIGNGNTVVACYQCNQERGDTDARLFLLQKQGWLA